jgi:hypothetical protein
MLDLNLFFEHTVFYTVGKAFKLRFGRCIPGHECTMMILREGNIWNSDIDFHIEHYARHLNFPDQVQQN